MHPTTRQQPGVDSEHHRLLALSSYGLLDTPPEPLFDDLARLAARLCGTPMALVSLVDDRRQWFKSAIGLDLRETPREIAFCAHTIASPGLFEVQDALQDAAFASNRLVTADPRLRFYAGVPLRVEGGHALGALAVLDRVPRRLSAQQRQDLQMLAGQVTMLLEERLQRRLAQAAMQEARRQSDSLLALAGHVARLGAWELDLAQDRVVWSDVVADIHGMARGFSPRPDEALAFYLEPGRSALARSVARCRDSGEPFDHELVLQPLGSRPRWVRSIGAAVRGPDGRITHLRGACQDITERKLQMLEMERLAERLAGTLEAIPDPFFTVGADGVVQLANSALLGLLGRPREAVVGHGVAAVLGASAFDPGLLERCSGVLHGGVPVDFETVDAQGRRFELRCFAVADGMAVHARDVTERKQAARQREALEGQLRQAQKMESIGTLAGGIAHDFNNILGSVLGSLSLARGALPAGSPALPALATIESSALRARVLVQQILAFGRQQPTQRLPQAVQPLVEETRRMLRSTLPANVSLSVLPSASDLCAEVDGNQLQQVLLNLCTNAWYALPPLGGRIEIGLDTAPPAVPLPPGQAAPALGWVHLWVRDNGCGIEPELLPRIFEPFFTTKPVGQGTGLGLSVAHGIVAAHHGCISVDSVRGQGSTFHLHLPRCAALPEQAVDLPPRSPAAGTLDGVRVLCVDDDPVMLLTMQALLEHCGCRVTGVLSGAEAQAEMVRASFAADVLVTDYNMPGMDGLSLIVATRRSHPLLPVVLASGFIDDALRARALSLGVHGLVQKERIAEDLAGAVRHAVAAGAAAGATPAATEARQAWRV